MSQVTKLYQNGNFKGCVEVFNEVSDKHKHVNLKVETLHEAAKEFLFKNNAALCQAINNHSTNDRDWSESMDRFITLYSNYKSLSMIPLDLEMNVVFNILWWFWIKPQSLPLTTLYLRSVLKSVSCCFIKVLKSCGELVLGQELCLDDFTSVTNLLKRASDQLLSLTPVGCVQLLDIITMTVQVVLRLREREVEVMVDCMLIMKKAIGQLELLRLHIRKTNTSGTEDVYFKFGFKCINSTASLDNCDESINAFVTTGSLVCAINREYESAVECLKEISREGINTSHFLENYLKAHCYLLLQRLSEAKLCLAYAMSTNLPSHHLAHYRFLLARLLSEQGDHQTSLVQCEAILASHPCQPGLSSLTAYLAAQQAEKLNIFTAQLNYLGQLVQCLKPGSPVENEQFENFEECCLSILSQKFSISLQEAVYILARQLYLAGYHVKALDSFNELLDLVGPEWSQTSLLLPCRTQMLHESALAHIKANDLSGGERLCRLLAREHLSICGSSGNTKSHWEAALYRLDDDIVALMLLADILAVSDNKKASEELNRCYSALTEWCEQSNSESETELCEWFMSRVLLRKARLCGNQDAAHYFHRALMHKPGDKEVIFYYKQWALWHPDHDSFDPGDTTVLFPVDQIHNLALRHVLGCSISEEEWGAVCNHDTSQNVIESLFDDE